MGYSPDSPEFAGSEFNPDLFIPESWDMFLLSEAIAYNPSAEQIDDNTIMLPSVLSPDEAARRFIDALHQAAIKEAPGVENWFWLKPLADITLDGQISLAKLGSEELHDKNYHLKRSARVLVIDHMHDALLGAQAVFKKEVALSLAMDGNSGGMPIKRSLDYRVVLEELGHKRYIRLITQATGVDLIHHGRGSGSTKITPAQLATIIPVLKQISGLSPA